MSSPEGIKIRHSTDGRYEIHFDYDEELVDVVRALPGRHFNRDGKFWSIPETTLALAVSALKAWGVRLDAGSTEALEKLASTDSPDSKKGHPDDLTIWELNRAVAAAITGRFPSAIWVVGEVDGLTDAGQRGNAFFELVDRSPDGTIRARVNVVIWQNAWEQIEQAMERTGLPFELENGLSVRAAVKVELFERDGRYRPAIQSIDPNYTLGEVARRRELVIRKLAEQGLLGLNTSIALPTLPLRVALITSEGSRARRDFEQRLRRSGFAFSLTILDVRVQGENAERTILSALQWCEQNREGIDVVALCRGGGSPTDLSWLDTLRLGQTVAKLPLPVVVGIGHEADSSVLDSVARSFPTPTACADNLVVVVGEAIATLCEQRGRLMRRAAKILEGERGRWRTLIRGIRFLAPQILRARRNAHLQVAKSILMATRYRIRAETKRTTDSTGQLRQTAKARIREAQSRLNDNAVQFLAASDSLIVSESEGLRRFRTKAVKEGMHRLQIQEERMAAQRHRLCQLHPRRVLERGFALLRLEAGQVIRDSAMAPAGVSVLAELALGALQLKSEGPIATHRREGEGDGE